MEAKDGLRFRNAAKLGADKRRRSISLTASFVAIFVGAWAAQSSPVAAREVVQALPPPGTEALNLALQRLAANPNDAHALIEAGFSALEIGDIEAAVGFFSRADEISPGNPRVKAGLGAAYVRSENPYDALLLFEEAERAGLASSTLAGDHGLALDLVGQNEAAQSYYRQALAAGPDAEVTRRLALSLAISGDRNAMESTLLPLLKQRDLAAYRMRAFALAILGDAKGAKEITDRVMPKDMAAQIVPYLRYMPNLTPAQQAAAANFGQFPRVANIGRDDPRVAKYTRPVKRSNDAGLLPAGEPLGVASGKRPEEAESGKGSKDRKKRATESIQTAQGELPPVDKIPSAQAAQLPRGNVAGSSFPLASSAAPAGTGEQPSIPVASRPTLPTGDAAIASFGSSVPAGPVAVPVPASSAAPERLPAPAVAGTSPPQGFAESAPQPVRQAAPVSEPTAQTVAEAFSDFAAPAQPIRQASGAVDITRIKPPREAPQPKADSKPKPPQHPSRNWVQVATGRDENALAFDWRRITKGAAAAFKGRQGYLAGWGRTNRLLTGPFPSAEAAQDFVTELKKAGVDAFTFASEEGEEIRPLKGKR